jgi:hypothetical protein
MLEITSDLRRYLLPPVRMGANWPQRLFDASTCNVERSFEPVFTLPGQTHSHLLTLTAMDSTKNARTKAALDQLDT